VTGRKLVCDEDCRADIGAYIKATVGADITNGQEARTHSCISLRPSGNIQGSLKCFDLETGKVVISRRVVQLPFPNIMLKKTNAWGKKSKGQIMKDLIQFLNRMGERFDWENDKVNTLQVVRSEPEKVQRDHVVPAEIPGIEIGDGYVAVQGPAVELETDKEPMDIRRLALAARVTAGLGEAGVHLNTTRGVDEHGAHDNTPTINLTGGGSFLRGRAHDRVKQEACRRNRKGNQADQREDKVHYDRISLPLDPKNGDYSHYIWSVHVGK